MTVSPRPVTDMAKPASPPPPPLRVIAPAPRPRQDCSRCRAITTCWEAGASTDAVVVNLLVCRIRQRIDENQATKVLLAMLRPKLRALAARIARGSGHGRRTNVANLVTEMESIVIERLMTRYVLGERMHPLHWLFNEPNGAMTRWAARRIARYQRHAAYTLSYGTRIREQSLVTLNRTATDDQVTSGPLVAQGAPAPEHDETAELREATQHALDLLDDGVTFPLAEYRVLRFCLDNAQDTDSRDIRAPVRGLHLELADHMAVPRRHVTRLYALASRRLLDATGRATSYLAHLGVRVPRSAQKRRANRRRHTPQVEALTPEEIHELIELRATTAATTLDLAWAYGVSEDLVYRLTRRFGGMTLEEICAIVNRW